MPNTEYNEINVIEENQTGNVLDGNYLKIIETDDVFKINFQPGQYIIVNNDDSGNVYFDPTHGTSINDRIHLNPKQEIDVYIKEQNKSFNYYLNLQTKPKDGDLVIIKEPIINSLSSQNNESNYIINNIPEFTDDFEGDENIFNMDIKDTTDQNTLYGKLGIVPHTNRGSIITKYAELNSNITIGFKQYLELSYDGFFPYLGTNNGTSTYTDFIIYDNNDSEIIGFRYTYDENKITDIRVCETTITGFSPFPYNTANGGFIGGNSHHDLINPNGCAKFNVKIHGNKFIEFTFIRKEEVHTFVSTIPKNNIVVKGIKFITQMGSKIDGNIDRIIAIDNINAAIVDQSSNKYINHIFIYNNNAEDTNDADWCELSDSYNSSNIYLDKDFLLTTNIPDNMYINPNIMEQTDGGILIKTKDKNINEVIEMIFSSEKIPEITRPDLFVQLLTKGNYVLGSQVPINFKAEFTKGKYEFGPDTNIRIGTSNVTVELYKNNQYDGTCTNINLEEQSDKYIITGSFNSRTLNNVNDIYRIKVKVSYSAGAIPKTAKGENYPDGRISASSITKYSNSTDPTGIISGYIEGLYIGTSNTELTSEDVNIDYLKTLTGTNSSYPNANKDITYNVSVGTKSIIIACPSDSNGFTKIYNETVNCFMDEAFGSAHQLTYTVDNVEYGYDYWIYTPADPYINRTKLIISIG